MEERWIKISSDDTIKKGPEWTLFDGLYSCLLLLLENKIEIAASFPRSLQSLMYVVTTRQMSSITMINAQTGRGKAARKEKEGRSEVPYHTQLW